MKYKIKKLYQLWRASATPLQDKSTLTDAERYDYYKSNYIFLFDDIYRLHGDPRISFTLLSGSNPKDVQYVTEILKDQGIADSEISEFYTYLNTREAKVLTELQAHAYFSRDTIVWLSASLILAQNEVYGYAKDIHFKEVASTIKKAADAELKLAGFAPFDLNRCFDAYLAVSLYRRLFQRI